MLKSVRVEGAEVKVQMWDIAGQERFFGLSRAFYMNASGESRPSLSRLFSFRSPAAPPSASPLPPPHSVFLPHPPPNPSAHNGRHPSAGAIVVFDLLDRRSFEAAAKWKKDIDDKIELPNGAKLPVLLLGNKADLLTKAGDHGESPPDACVTQQGIDSFVAQNGFYRYWPCSALTGSNVVDAIDDLMSEVVRRMKQPSANFKPSTGEHYHQSGAGSSSAAAAAAPVKLSNSLAPAEKSGCC